MKKILLLFAFACLIPIGCGPDPIEVIVKENPHQTDPHNDDNDPPPPPGEVSLKIDEILWNASEGFLRLNGNEAVFPTEINPTHVGIRLFQNGVELNPTGYWMFEQKNGTIVWYRPAQINLVPGEIINAPLQIQLFAKTADSDGFELYLQITKDINWGRTYIPSTNDTLVKGKFEPAPRTTFKD